MSKIKIYTEEQVRKAIELARDTHPEGREYMQREEYDYFDDEVIDLLTPIELPSDDEIIKHIDYLISCRQNLIDNADNMPQHLLEGGCMAFESAIDNARELFLKVKK